MEIALRAGEEDSGNKTDVKYVGTLSLYDYSIFTLPLTPLQNMCQKVFSGGEF
jgi:hypothetical protein